VQLASNNGSLFEPNGVAFDNSGDLWVANQGANTAIEYAPSELGASGAPTPADTIDAPYVIGVAPPPAVHVQPGSAWTFTTHESGSNTCIGTQTFAQNGHTWRDDRGNAGTYSGSASSIYETFTSGPAAGTTFNGTYQKQSRKSGYYIGVVQNGSGSYGYLIAGRGC
jgi:hypothetical protein